MQKKYTHKYLHVTILCCLSVLNTSLALKSLADETIAPNFTINDPGQTHVFVKNHGQFDKQSTVKGEKISYVLNSNDYVCFNPNGYVWKLSTHGKTKHRKDLANFKSNNNEHEVQEREDELRKIATYHVKMNWEGANPNSEIVSEEEADGYYTYAAEEFRDLKAKGYRKLIYKELYPDIDVEYILPKDKGGIKYSLILNPGADIRKVKMHYEGDINKLRLSKTGNLIISTPAGDMIDHAPQSFYKKSKATINSSFVLRGTSISFRLSNSNGQELSDIKESIIIDPWTIAPNLYSGKGPYDVDYDKYGNVYIDFNDGTSAPQISKYTATGVFLWTINMKLPLQLTFFPSYSDFCVIPSGSVFIASGYQTSGGTLCKVSSSGILLNTANWPATLNLEGWVVAYNQCLNILLIGGGGTLNTISLRMGVDTSLIGNFTGNNFNAGNTVGNDIARMLIDDNGDMFTFFASDPAAGSQNKIYKSIPPYTTFSYSQLRTSCAFSESKSIVSSNRLNVMDINKQYLIFFDGKNLEARTKATGNLITSIIVSPSYNCGYNAGIKYKNEGIAVDECNNVYVGGQKLVHVFNFNGSAFTILPTIPVSGDVYDIMLDKEKQLIYVTGNGFLSSFDALPCSINSLTITPSSTGACFGDGTATASVTGGNPSYTYTWSNGATAKSITAPAGTYTVTVTDGSCGNPQLTTATITIDSNCDCTLTGQFTKGSSNCTNCGCKEWVLVNGINGTPPYTYQWSDGYDKRYKNKMCAGNYLVTIKDKNGCSVDVNITAP